jgi:hypothetical protein
MMLQRICFISGFVIAALFAIGFITLSDFLPPPPATLSAMEVAAFYQQHPIQREIGMFLIMTSMGMLAPWGAVLATRLRAVERGFPTLTYIQLANCAVATMVVVLCPMFWAAAAYRPFDTPPEILRVMNDIGWFLVLAPWPPFTFWLAGVALAILNDDRPNPEFPRWTAFLSLWAAVLFIPAGAVLIFKDGPFAWDGIIAFYIPVIIFFVWLMVMSFYGTKATYRNDGDPTTGHT